MIVYLSLQDVVVHSDRVTWIFVAIQGENTHSTIVEDKEGCIGGGGGGARKGMKSYNYDGDVTC